MEREKQIEEMRKDIPRDLEIDGKDIDTICEILANKSYRKQEWISVEDRLPINDYEKHWKDRNYYLVYTEPSGLMFVAKYGYKMLDKWIDEHDCVLSTTNYKKVTHYMPLPTPPKMKGAE